MIHWLCNVIEPLISGPVEDLIEFLHIKGNFKRYVKTGTYLLYMEKKPYSRNSDGMAFRCCNKNCNDFSKHVSILFESLLSSFTVLLKSILLVACK
ncbi:hypothetical protein HERIO_1864 [Hepatospora eriocheir]|uniref:Uncharacterized protein n=1 Tax=Hepatospora eriocheir TaxID=1081669 RepID=A0A1X0Q8R5_9MICR|nr:hypothetical protein HERIO_1864 [Hepatospora eriocheir]